MKPSKVAESIDRLFDTRWALFLWGPPGAGKSSVVREVAARRGVPVLDMRAALLDPTDIRGIPAVVDGRAIWCPPEFLPKPDATPGILFLDELSAAPPLVQASLYQLVLDRRVGEYVLPDGWRIIAAGNRDGDRAITYRMPSALSNRFIHIDFEVDFDDWRDWAVNAGIHPLILGFLSLRRELLFDMAHDLRAFPTPRSWEIASDALHALQDVRSMVDVLAGIVGDGAAVELLAFAESSITEETIKRILGNPAKARIPKALGDQYALIAYVAARAREQAVVEAAGRLLARIPVEMAILLARDVLRVQASFVTHPGYRAFIATHGEALV